MNGRLTFYLFFLISIASSAQGGLVSYYKFDGNAVDFSDNKNHGLVSKGVIPTFDRFGNPCSAMKFDGITGFIEVPNSPSLSSPTTALTIAIWYKLSTQYASPNNYWLTAVCKGIGSLELSNSPQYRLQIQQNTNVIPNACSSGAYSTSSTISLSTPFTVCDYNFSSHFFKPDEWHHYALVYTGDRVISYMDNIEVFSQDFSAPLEINSSPLFIGMDEPGQKEFFFGALDDLVIFNRALSVNELDSLFHESRPLVDFDGFIDSSYNNLVFYLDKYQCTKNVVFQSPVVSNGCGIATVNQIEGFSPGYPYPLGKTTVSFEIFDESNYREYVSFDVTILDTISPIFNPVADTTIFLQAGVDSILFQYSLPSAYDNCGVKSVSLLSGTRSGEYLKIGTFDNSFVAEDLSGNKGFTRFNIQVRKGRDTLGFSGKADTLSTVDYRPNTILFLLDVSGSMGQNNKLNILKESVISALAKLRAIDQVGVIAYSSKPLIISELSYLSNKSFIIDSIRRISPSGTTNFDLGLKKSYDLLVKQYVSGSNHQIFVITDGIFDLTNEDGRLIQKMSHTNKSPISLNVILIKPSKAIVDKQRLLLKKYGGNLLIINDTIDTDLLVNQIIITCKII